MRVFVDTNVWNAAFMDLGLCAKLIRAALAQQDADNLRLMVCPTVRDDIFRLLGGRFGASAEQQAMARTLFKWVEAVLDGTLKRFRDFPAPDDTPIVGTAVAAKSNLFVAGDKALLAPGRIEPLELPGSRTACLRLEGLA